MRHMKSRGRAKALLLFFLGCTFARAQVVSDLELNRCGSYERDVLRGTKNFNWKTGRLQLDSLVNDYLAKRKNTRTSVEYEVIRIPVVVHVVHDQAETAIGGLNNPNISDAQIQSQIDVLNEDYRRIAGTRGFNTNPVGADSFIEFYLAEFDPNGRPTTGITRHRYLTKTSFNPFSDEKTLADIAYWPSDKYLNIWTCRLTNNYLGIAQFPTVAGINGLSEDPGLSEVTDGVIIDFRYFGRNMGAITSRIYNLGRTTTHEVAHWLGLIHTWGDAFCGDDYCADTPPTEEPNRTTVCEAKFSNCKGVRTRNMIENYLDYSPDSCMNIFTLDQVARMRAVMTLSPRRAQLVEYSRQGRLEPADRLTVDLYPNPATTEFNLDVRFNEFENLDISIYNAEGKEFLRNTFEQVWSRRLVVDVSVLPAGVYYIKIATTRESLVKRFVVN